MGHLSTAPFPDLLAPGSVCTSITINQSTVVGSWECLLPVAYGIGLRLLTHACTPEPWTLNPEPWTLNPEPQPLNPEPWTLHPEPWTRAGVFRRVSGQQAALVRAWTPNPEPWTLNPEPWTRQVFFDVSADSKPLGRIVFELFADVTPKTAGTIRSKMFQIVPACSRME
jgi:hypothetical protein